MIKISILFLLLFQPLIFNQTMELQIVPAPQKMDFESGSFRIPDEIKISIPGKNLNYAAGLLKRSLMDFQSVAAEISGNENAEITFRISEKNSDINSNFKNEGYNLSISDRGILIEAPSDKGLFYGSMSLLQLIEKDRSLPFVEIVDWPDLAVRGISDDISRGQVSTLENFKKIIRHIARYKMNTYMPYLEDMLVFEDHPLIGKDRGALTREEVKEIVSFSEENFVEVVPIFQTLGHYENILLLEEYIKYAEFPGAASLNVSNDSIYIFLEGMMKEIFEIFPTKYFHMGADESYDVGLGASKHLVEETDIATVHANHYKKIYNICKKYGKEVIMYGDIILQHPDILKQIPKDITVVDWHYRAESEYPSTVKFKEAGFDYYVSPSVWNFLTTFPTNVNALPNIQYITKAGIENGAKGMINSNWGDYGSETIKEFVLFGYAWSAQCAWNYEASDLNNFSDNYFYDFFGIDDKRLSDIYVTLSNPLNQMMWHEVWRHPLLPLRTQVWWEPNMSRVGKISWSNWTLPEVTESISLLEEKVIKNRDHFDLITFIVDLNNWYSQKLETQFLLHDSLKLNNRSDIAIEMIDQNISDLKNLKNNYRDLWLRYYKEENLKMIDDKFDRLTSYFEETKEEIKNNKFVASPLIDSKWIYVILTDSIKEGKTEITYADKAEFKNEFEISGSVDEALLQIMADTYAKIYINDKYVDQLYARRSLSLLVDYGRIKFIDISKHLKQGKNEIRIEVENFNRRGAAGVNVSGIIKSDNKSEKIISSIDSWKGRTNSSEWENVAEKDYPYLIIAPNFETKRTSWIER